MIHHIPAHLEILSRGALQCILMQFYEGILICEVVIQERKFS